MKLLIFLLIFIHPASLSVFEGRVTSVVDGDTIEVLKDGKAIRIRLNGIDCPEKTQAFGTKAKQFTSDLVYGKLVRIKEKEFDRYGRTIADVYVGGLWLNKALLDAGLAWHYKKYSSDETLAQAEQNARKSNIGLWSESSPIEPWNYRRSKSNYN
jgi:micrococcal nuclease